MELLRTFLIIRPLSLEADATVGQGNRGWFEFCLHPLLRLCSKDGGKGFDLFKTKTTLLTLLLINYLCVLYGFALPSVTHHYISFALGSLFHKDSVLLGAKDQALLIIVSSEADVVGASEARNLHFLNFIYNFCRTFFLISI